MDCAPPIEWRVHFSSAAADVYRAWTTDEGRVRFWSEESRPAPGGFDLTFINGETITVELVEAAPSERFVFRYFGGSTVAVSLADDGNGGCDLHLIETDADEPLENYAGWVAVLLALKAAVDFGDDIRSHDPARTWDQRYVDC